jgi:hypothetical protein
MRRKAAPKPIYTLDAETDPFLQGRIPAPFAWCICRLSATPSKGKYAYDVSWGENCTPEIVSSLYELPAGIVYMHNGGKFDINFLWDYVDKEREASISNGRVLSCYIKCRDGYHEIRDSYKIFPAPLASYSKTEISYAKFEAGFCYDIKTRKKVVIRELYRDEIVAYLKDDCAFLHDICSGFITKFGKPYLTIGSCATAELKKLYDLGPKFTRELDADLRPFYFGGRVQCFEKGIITGDVRAYDVNSMYPYVMANYWHPIGHPQPYNNREITEETFFLTVEGVNKGAFISSTKQGKTFEIESGIFNVTIHEYETALDLHLFETRNILRTVDFAQRSKFDLFVNPFYAQRQLATDAMKSCEKHSAEWKVYSLEKDFNKNLLNNSYGKQAINPANYYRYKLTNGDTDIRCDWCEGKYCEEVDEDGCRQYVCGGWHRDVYKVEQDLMFWKKPSERVTLNNVAIGASITGAARSYLMRGISAADRPIYCDTDSIVCVGELNMPVHSSNLGAWKLEYQGDRFAVYGKKGYNLSKIESKNGIDKRVNLKSASKGAQLTPSEIEEVAAGKVIHYMQAAPCFSLGGSASWIERDIRMT